MNNSYEQSDQGFVRIVVILVTLMLVFAFAGFNFQESLSVDRVLANIKNLWSKLVVLYNDMLQPTVQSYLIEPSKKLHFWINEYIINGLIAFTRDIITKPPIK
jgi:hypothetical protein